MCAVGVGLSDPAIRELPDLRAIWEQNVFLPVRKFNCLDPVFLYPLDRSIWEDAFFLTICIDTFDRSIRESIIDILIRFQNLHYFFSSVWEMLLNLSIRKLKDLKPIRESALGSFGLCKIVDYLLIWVGLLNVVIIEIDDCVTIWESLSLDPIVEYNFFLAIFIYALDLSISSDMLLNHFHVAGVSIMVFFGEFHIILFFSILCVLVRLIVAPLVRV